MVLQHCCGVGSCEDGAAAVVLDLQPADDDSFRSEREFARVDACETLDIIFRTLRAAKSAASRDPSLTDLWDPLHRLSSLRPILDPSHRSLSFHCDCYCTTGY